jgi:TRAP-type C4-dicarboxylate transport system permease small subunit
MKRLLAATETVAALFLLLIAVVTAVNVALRDLLSVQIPDWFDGTKMLMSIALFWGIAVTTYHGSHISVDVLWEHLRKGGRRSLDVVAGLFTLAFLAPMAWMVFTKVLGSGTQATMDLRIPLWWFTSVAATGAVAGAVLALARLVQLMSGQEPEAGTTEHAELRNGQVPGASLATDAVRPPMGGDHHRKPPGSAGA